MIVCKNNIRKTVFVKIACFCILLISSFTNVLAQEKSTVSGRVLAQQKSLPGATIIITRLKDKAKLSSHISNGDGRFTITSLPQRDSLKIEISCVGYLPFKGLLVLKEKRFDMAAVTLEPQSNLMDTVIVKAEKLLSIKGDTLEFNASFIKTPPNSMTADLLKRIPGLEITRDGRLSYNGKPVTKILVDGKIFFSEDGGVALNNIPADMIAKIQLINETVKTEIGKEETDAGQVLNLKLKPGKKYFANGYTAAGTNQRYNGSLFGSYMVGRDNFALTLGRNNTNQPAGNSIQMATAGSGITSNTAGSIEYDKDYTHNRLLGINYSFSYPATVTESVLQRRQDILDSTLLITNVKKSIIDNGSNHALNLRYQARGGKRRNVMATGFANYGMVNSETGNNTTTNDGRGHLLNALSGAYSSHGINLSSGLSANGIEFFKKKGRTLEWDLGFDYRNTNIIGNNDLVTLFYKNNVLDSQHYFRQYLENKSQLTDATAIFRYTEQVSKNTSLSFRNNWSKQWGRMQRNTWSLDSLGHKIEIDSLYSNALISNAVSNTTEVSFAYHRMYWFINAGVSLIQNLTQQEDAIKKTEIRQRTNSPALNSTIKYSGQKMVWSLSTAANYILPALDQLQPIADVTNPLYVVEGNPALKPQILYKNSIGWKNKKQQVNGQPAAIFNTIDLTWNAVRNKIINSVYYDTSGKQRASYQNVNGTYSLSGRLVFSYQKKWGAHLFSANLMSGASYQKDKIFINGRLYESDRTALQPSINFNYKNSDLVTCVVVYAPSFNRMHYQQNNSLDQSYALHALKINLDLYLLNRIKMMQSLDYTYNSNLPFGYNRSSLLWNTSASFICLKNKKGEISFTAFDILRQFNNLVRIVGSNYIEDTQSNNLQRYFMIGFKYFFDKIKTD